MCCRTSSCKHPGPHLLYSSAIASAKTNGGCTEPAAKHAVTSCLMPKTFQPADAHVGDREVWIVMKNGVEREWPTSFCRMDAT